MFKQFKFYKINFLGNLKCSQVSLIQPSNNEQKQDFKHSDSRCVNVRLADVRSKVEGTSKSDLAKVKV